MAFELLYAVKRPTLLKLDPSVNVNNVQPGMVAIVNAAGNLAVGGAAATGVVGVFQVQGYVPPYQSTGLLATQLGGEPGSPGGGTKVSVIAGAGATFKTDQVVAGVLTATPGSKLESGALGKLQVATSGDVVGIFLGLSSEGLAIVQMRL